MQLAMRAVAIHHVGYDLEDGVVDGLVMVE
jgi:hypothetical protein